MKWVVIRDVKHLDIFVPLSFSFTTHEIFFKNENFITSRVLKTLGLGCWTKTVRLK